MYIELLILIQIEMAPKHGYEIKKEIQRDLGYLTDVNHNMLYPTLRRFTEQGLITKKINEQDGKPNQFVYEITEAGKTKITDLINAFSEKDAKHQIEFLIRVSLFQRISRDNQLRILNMRKKDLEALWEDLKKREGKHVDDWYRNEVLQVSISQVKGEMLWIDELIRKTDS
ncbi:MULTISPECIES: PadR family transcriptional regulator [Paenibacillus]|uniref:PadR family transcriptional regulator n=1 Tax=Paenibacillus TaxID=44249 RepID=UPI00116237F8|nr:MULTISPECIES: PadR family transcriptional regulator [Paenibacillus]AWP27910.1 PadR family transcriptional regulator [Paenibacillus sp. Cedars]MPY17320.1 PadR family transcriptional regulator [Paenibacillus glucanolyticus]